MKTFLKAICFCLAILLSYVSIEGSMIALAIIPIVDLYQDTKIGIGRFFGFSPINYTRSFVAENGVRFGRAVMRGTSFLQGRNFAGVAATFIGVSAYSTDATLLSSDSYADKDPLGVMQAGLVTVFCEEAVNAGDAVRIRHTDGVGPNLGKLAGSFAKTADVGRTSLLSQAEYRSTTTAAGEAVVFLSGVSTKTND